MIEINLVPDVKQELIHAKQVRTLVISGAIVIGAIAIAIVILMALYLFGVQALRSAAADRDIAAKNKQLAATPDLANLLTIQHQLTKLTAIYDQTNVDSRFFDLLGGINPAAPNQVSFSLAHIDSDTRTIRLEGQAENGYVAADVLKKTILGTQFSYKEDGGDTKTVPLTENVSTSELSYGEDSTGRKVLRFTLSFVYDDAFFARTSQNLILIKPEKQDATDSYLRLPTSLFSDRAIDVKGAN